MLAQIMLLKQKLTAEVKRIGIDIVFVPRIARLIKRYDKETLHLLFTSSEVDRCRSANDVYFSYAVCFATKEAVAKALGDGLVNVDWNEIEIDFTESCLNVYLHGKAKVTAIRQGLREWIANWFYWDDHILVHVLAQ